MLPGVPRFLTQPESQSAVLGSGLVLNSSVQSLTPYWVQWRKDGSPIANATNGTLSFPNLGLENAASYDVVATNATGTATSSTAILQVLPANAPSIRVDDLLAVNTVPVSGAGIITISGGFPGGFIFFTLDGSLPTTSSALYASSFQIATNRTIRAMSLSSDFSQSVEAPAVEVVFPPRYSLTTLITGHGNVGLFPPVGPYLSNSVVTLTAAAAANWAFDHWNGDLAGGNNPTNLTVSGPRTVEAVFIPTAHPLTLSTLGGGSVTANGVGIPPNSYYPVGSSVSLAASPNSGWSFLTWEGTATSSANPFFLTMSQPQTLQAIFGTMVGSNIGGEGTILLGAANPVPYGTLLSVTAVPSPGYRFVTWSGAASGTVTPTTMLVTNATPVIGALFAVLPGPTIVTQPTNTTVLLGKPTTLAVQAVGTLPLTYQWRRDGSNLLGATAADAGSYEALVTNGVGSFVTSSNISVTVKAWSPVAFESSTRLPDGRVQFLISGESNQLLWVDRTLSLPPAWNELRILFNTNGSVQFTDDGSTNLGQSFYRARQ